MNQNLGTYNRYQAEEFGRFVQRLKDTPEPLGTGNMLDNTFAMQGSASSSFHLSRNYPIIADEQEAKYRVRAFEEHGPTFERYLNDSLTKSCVYLTIDNVHP